MAETLTYDPGSDTVTSEDNLTPDEQESMKIGEELAEQQQQLLAGKYKNAEDLEKAYVELQKKLGGEGTEDSGTTGNPKILLTTEKRLKKQKKLRKILKNFT